MGRAPLCSRPVLDPLVTIGTPEANTRRLTIYGWNFQPIDSYCVFQTQSKLYNVEVAWEGTNWAMVRILHVLIRNLYGYSPVVTGGGGVRLLRGWDVWEFCVILIWSFARSPICPLSQGGAVRLLQRNRVRSAEFSGIGWVSYDELFEIDRSDRTQSAGGGLVGHHHHHPAGVGLLSVAPKAEEGAAFDDDGIVSGDEG